MAICDFKITLFAIVCFQLFCICHNYWDHSENYQEVESCFNILPPKSEVIRHSKHSNSRSICKTKMWEIRASRNHMVHLNFSSFHLEEGCNVQELKIIALSIEKNEIKESQYGPFCGYNFPETIELSAAIIYVTHTLIRMNARSEFSISYIIDNKTMETNRKIENAQIAANEWIKNLKKNIAGTGKWGNQVSRIAITLFLSNQENFTSSDIMSNEIIYEVDRSVLSSLLRNQETPMSETQIAIYIHALLVTCLNPRDFHGINLVAKLRHLVNNRKNYTSPLAMLALCNANDKTTEEDISKVIYTFNQTKKTAWTSTQALALMALLCISSQLKTPLVDDVNDMRNKIMKKQSDDGSFENVYTTALAMQAIFASGNENNQLWNRNNAMDFLLRNQIKDGSFGNFLNTYYVLPVLYDTSLLSITSSHCVTESADPDFDYLDNLNDELNKTMWVKYSVWFGENLDIVRSIIVRVKNNCTFFDVMKAAEFVDNRYKFKYFMSDGKPHIFSLNDYQDDPENERFWFLHKINSTQVVHEIIYPSPVDVFPENKEEFVMWYRKGQWYQEVSKTIEKDVLLLEGEKCGSMSDNLQIGKHKNEM